MGLLASFLSSNFCFVPAFFIPVGAVTTSTGARRLARIQKVFGKPFMAASVALILFDGDCYVKYRHA